MSDRFDEKAREIGLFSATVVAACLRDAHNAALEEAADIAEEWGWSAKPDHAHGIRDAIRDLKVGKP